MKERKLNGPKPLARLSAGKRGLRHRGVRLFGKTRRLLPVATREGCQSPEVLQTKGAPKTEEEATPGCRLDQIRSWEILCGYPAGDQEQSESRSLTETVISGTRQTKKGDILLELNKDGMGLQAFSEAVRVALGEASVGRNLVLRVTLEFLDLDSTTSRGDVEAALQEELGDRSGNAKVSMSKVSRWGQLMAFVDLDEAVAKDLLKKCRLKIGWISSRIRIRVKVVRCFRCLGYPKGLQGP